MQCNIYINEEGKGRCPKNKYKNVVLDHNGGGGVVNPNHTFIAKLHLFLNIRFIFYYTQFVVSPQ